MTRALSTLPNNSATVESFHSSRSGLIQEGNGRLMQLALHSFAKVFPRFSGASSLMNEVMNTKGRSLLQADTFPDLNQFATNVTCVKPITDYVLPRVDKDNCSVPFFTHGVDNPPPGLSQCEINTLEPTFNALALGFSFDGPEDKEQQACSYFRVANDVFATAGHCASGYLDNSDHSIVLAIGFERMDQPCILSGAKVIEQQLSIRPGATKYDYPRATSDFALVRTRPSNETLDTTAYPIAQLTTRLPEVGETVFVLGHPASLPAQWQKASVTGVNFNDLGNSVLNPSFKLDALSLPGSSGGPVIDTEGKVLGLVSFGRWDRLTDPDASGDIEYGPQYLEAFSIQGAVAHSHEMAKILLEQQNPSSPVNPSVQPFGMEPEEKCAFGVLAGDSLAAAMARPRPYTANVAEFAAIAPAPAPKEGVNGTTGPAVATTNAAFSQRGYALGVVSAAFVLALT